ncbi:MAG: tetratricopeptide repeat protein [Saprospiraceae bacterium]
MNKQKFGALLVFLFSGLTFQAFSQCGTWNESDRKSEAEDAHVVYRGHIKENNFDAAFPYWEKAYTIAPAADGQRSFHFSDGVEIYLHKFKNATDEAQKKEFAQKIMDLYDQWVKCYPKEKGYARGRQAYNMFYTLQSDYQKLNEVLKEALEAGGQKSEYIILDPYAHVSVWMFQNNLMEAEEARKIHTALVELADYNIANDKTYGPYYQQAKDAMLGTFATIERDIFDCDYFKNKYLPQYKADPENKEVYREVYKQLVKGGCDKTDPIVYEIFLKDSIATMEDFKTNNPGYYANELYKQGQFEEAIAKYEEAISKEDDAEKLADYHLAIASIQFRKLNRYSAARSSALQAAKLKPNWGQPYMLIGDMYAQSSSSCGSNAFEKDWQFWQL